jgi:hypothetical protein
MLIAYFLLGVGVAFLIVFLAKIYEKKRGDKKDD